MGTVLPAWRHLASAAMILIGLGANLPGPWGKPSAALACALARLDELGVRVRARSRDYESAPVPPSDQPWFVNAVAALDTTLDPASLLALLQRIETGGGRVRGAANAARSLDLDLLDYDGRISAGPPVLPHPRMHERAFVLAPLAEIAPQWRHPALGLGARVLLDGLGGGLAARPL